MLHTTFQYQNKPLTTIDFKALNDYLDSLQNLKNYSEHTIKAYRKDITNFLGWLKIDCNKSYEACSEKDISAYLKKLYKEKKASNSISRITSSIKGFFIFHKQKNNIQTNPLKNIPNRKKTTRLPTFLYQDKVKELLYHTEEATSKKNPLHKNEVEYFAKRDQLAIEMLYGLGLRISELSLIELRDIKMESIYIRGKGKKIRNVPLTERLIKMLDDYLSMRNDFLQQFKIHVDENHLLLNAKGKGLSIRGIRYLFYETMKKINMKEKIYPHALRHSIATHLLDNHCDIRKVQALLGHKSISSTQIYTHLTKENLKKKYQLYHPLAQKK